jgi:hypothetical protein
MSVDRTTLARWERGEKEPMGDFAARVKSFLAKEEDTRRDAGRKAKAAVIIGDVRQLA